jgi:hypothetical protein
MIDPQAVCPTIMPTKVGIHDFLCGDEGKSWIPAFAGMTRWAKRRRVNL